MPPQNDTNGVKSAAKRELTQRLITSRADARDELRDVRGLRSIGVGIRQRAGRFTGEFVFRVYVDRKQPESSLPVEEIIPTQLAGFPTDVVEFGLVKLLGAASAAAAVTDEVAKLQQAPKSACLGNVAIGALLELDTLVWA